MTLLAQQASILCAATGVVISVVIAARTRDVRQGLGVLLDLLLAACLLRLSSSASWSALLTATAIVLVRELVTSGGLTSPGD